MGGERERERRFVITLHPLSLKLLRQSASLPGKVATVLESTTVILTNLKTSLPFAMSCLASILSAQSSQTGSAKDTPRQLSISLHCIWHCSREETPTTEKPHNRVRPSVVLPSVVVVVSGRVVVIVVVVTACVVVVVATGVVVVVATGVVVVVATGVVVVVATGVVVVVTAGVVVVVVTTVVLLVVVTSVVVVVASVVVVQLPSGWSSAWAFSVAMSQASAKLSNQAGSSAAKRRTASAAGPVGLSRFPQSLFWFPQHCPLSPLPGLPPQYSPSLFATASWMVSDVNHAQQSCSVAKTGPPFCPFSLYTRQRSVFNIISCPSKLVSLPMSLRSHWFLPAFPLTASSGIQPLASSET